MRLTPLGSQEVKNIIDKLTNKTSSPDGINNRIIKQLKTVLTPVLTKMVNLSFKQGIFPQKCKLTKIKPILKSGDSTDPANYRPIAVLSAQSRVQETAMKIQLEAFLDKTNFFFKSQYGFRANKDLNGALFDLVYTIQNSLDRHKIAAVVFIDLRKAFDTVDHKILLDKLDKIGVRGHAHSWLNSYLSNRQQYVIIKNIISKLETVLCGVPQGSILGPLLFLIYINDIGRLKLNGKLELFADDSAIIYEENNPKELSKLIIEDLETLYSWFTMNKLSFNATKTVYMLFTKPSIEVMNLNIELGTEKIRRVSTTQYLGVTLDENLKWEDHINQMLPKLRASNRLLYRLKPS